MKKPGIRNSLFYMTRFFVVPICIAVLFFILLSAPAVFSSQEGVASRIKSATSKIDGAEKNLPPLPRNIVRANVEYQGGTFFTETRKSEIKRFKCSSCHNNKPVPILNAANISHADIKVVHGAAGNQPDCNTCHSQEDRDYLVTDRTGKIDMDHVYDMCGQCHFRQKKDWIGGAHGKRVTYWAGERVVKNCTSCHNPHSPRFEKRWPSTYSVPFK